ncbi:MAG: hypothetical protein ACKOUR_12855 [Planctomycetota bacterium]
MSELGGGERRQVTLQVSEPAGWERVQEVVSYGVPLARGELRSTDPAVLRNSAGQRVPLQSTTLATWLDGSIKWLLVRFPVSLDAHQTASYTLSLDEAPAGTSDSQSRLQANPWRIEESATGVRISSANSNYFLALSTDSWLTRQNSQTFLFELTDVSGKVHRARSKTITVIERGPLVVTAMVHGDFGRGSGRLTFTARLEFHRELADLRCDLTIENPCRAQHPDNHWDLGDAGSVLIQRLALRVVTTADEYLGGEWQAQAGEPRQTFRGDLAIEQESSGGANWDSRNHLDRERTIPLRYRGYRVTSGDRTLATGERARPVVYLNHRKQPFGIAPLEFWEKFPTAITARDGELCWDLFPSRPDRPHELQGGEHCTRSAWLAFESLVSRHEDSSPDRTTCARLRARHDPLIPQSSLPEIAHRHVIPHLPATTAGQRAATNTLLAAMIEGETSFFHKREVIDEYGWRNFGDVWADHEEAYCDAPRPVISHYNNQYDLLFGFLLQYVMTGERRWWQLADPLARHVMDIDIYHTKHDKSAYNGGLFWHTMHYFDATTSTHRCVSHEMQKNGQPIGGTGPGNEHNYSRGLSLYYFMTGDQRARDTVIGLADWVLSMDSGREHLLGIFSDAATGNSTSTVDPDFHGPGRGAGNSIHTLLDAWLLTREARYLQFVEQIIRRTIHPADDLVERNLLNVEFRWSYTVYLQALDRYLITMQQESAPDDLLEYVQASLLHYARWMADHELNYLDKPAQLEFPTETWAAQDLRKGLVLQQAAHWAVGAERTRLWTRGQQLLDQAWTQLMEFPSRSFSRPSALVLSQCYIERRMALQPVTNEQPPARQLSTPAANFGSPSPFIRQKALIKRQARSPLGAIRLLLKAARPGGWLRALRQSWWAARWRRWRS